MTGTRTPSSHVHEGELNRAEGILSGAGGAEQNTASGYSSVVSGGRSRAAGNTDDWVAGNLFEDQ